MRSVYIGKIKFGLSEADGGEIVLTPYGSFGSCYEYNKRLYQTFRRIIRIIYFIFLGMGGFLIFLQINNKINSGQFSEIFAVSIIFIDILRIILIKLVFRNGEKLIRGRFSVRNVPREISSVSGMFPYRKTDIQSMFYALVLMEMIMMFGVIADIFIKYGENKQYVVVALGFYTFIYSNRHTLAQWYC
jgi:hypothetical protein